MNGTEALQYARSRHTTSDFDRAARQQRLLLVAARAGQPAGAHPAAARARQGPQGRGQDRHPGRPARRAARARVVGRHDEHQLVRLPAAALRQRDAARGPDLQDVPERRRASGRPSRTRSSAIRWTRRRPRRSPRKAPRSGCSTATTTGTADRPRRLPRVPRPGRVVAAPEAGRRDPGEDEDRRLQRRRDAASRTRSRTSRRRSRSRSSSRPTRPSGPTSSSRSGRTPRSSRRRRSPDSAPRPRRPVDPRLTRSGSASAWYSGSRPRTASK